MRVARFQPQAALPYGTIVLIMFLLVFAVLAGIATALAGVWATALFGGLVLGLVALSLPLPWLVVGLVVLSFLIAGQLEYFAHFSKAFWFPFLLGALLLVRFPLDSMMRGYRTAEARDAEPHAPAAAKFLIVLYFSTLFASTLINASPPMQIFVSSKEYLFLWGLYLVLAAGLIKPEMVARIWNLLPWLMLLQLPLVIYQRFVVMPSRMGLGAAWDAVVGAFGGDPFRGGASGAMGLFCVMGIVTVLARWRERLMPGWQALLLGLAGLLCIGLAEIKFMVLLLPIAIAMLFMRELAHRPVRALAMMSMGLVMAAGIMYAYRLQYTHKEMIQTQQEYVDKIVKAGNLDTDFVNMRTTQIGRVASIVFWYRKHSIEAPLHLLLGHGAGASRVGALVVGEAAKPYPFQITRSAIGILLWEVGLIGTFAYVGLLCAAYLMLLRQSREVWRSAEARSTLASMAVAVAMLIASIPYDTGVMAGHQMIVVLMLCLGYAVMMNRRSGIAGEPVPVSSSARNFAGVPARHRF